MVNLEHAARAVDDVSAAHRAVLLPALAARLTGGERRALDLGCGVGRLTADLAGLIGGEAIGVDPVEELLALAPADPRVEYRTMHPPRLPLADGEVDLVFTCLVLGGLTDAASLHAMGEEVLRVLAPGGVVFIAESVSQRADAGHWAFRSVADYRAAFPWAGLQAVAWLDDGGDPVSAMAGRAPVSP